MIDIWMMTDTSDVSDQEPFKLKLLKIVGGEENTVLDKKTRQTVDYEACLRQKKVSAKILQILRMIFKGKSPKSDVFSITLQLVMKDQLTIRQLVRDLVGAGYSEKTSIAQAHQMTTALTILKIVSEGAYGNYIQNKDSTLLERIRNQNWCLL